MNYRASLIPQMACKSIGLTEDLTHYFALFLVKVTSTLLFVLLIYCRKMARMAWLSEGCRNLNLRTSPWSVWIKLHTNLWLALFILLFVPLSKIILYTGTYILFHCCKLFTTGCSGAFPMKYICYSHYLFFYFADCC